MRKTIEKELKDIPFELRTLRLEKANQETENRGLFNKKITLIESIAALEKEQNIEKEKHRRLVARNVTEAAKAKKREEGYAMTEAGLGSRDKLLKSKEESYAERVISLEKDRATFERSEASSKKRQVDFKKEKEAFSQEKAQHQKNLDAFEAGKKDASTRASNIEKREEAITKNESVTIANLDKAKSLKGIAEEGDKELKEKERAFAEKERKFESEKAELAKEKEALDLDKENLKKEQTKIEAGNRSLDRAYDVLEQQRKEDRVKRLRVEKLIREKDITKELKALEKSLKK